jgi:hypothetical protein
MMKSDFSIQYVFILVCFFIFTNSIKAQKWEHGIALGGSNYQGDLAKKIVLGESHLAYGIFSRYNISDYWSFRGALQYGKISGSDAHFDEYKYRNLNFQTNLWELSAIMEFNFLPFGTNPLTNDLTSYAFFGVSGFRFNPKALYKDELHELKPLRTEGQTNKSSYGLVQLAIPFGGGLKYSLSKNWVFGVELGWRKIFTDYLDDVSTTYQDRAELVAARGQLSADLSDRSWEVEGVGEPLAAKGNMRGDPNLKDWYIFSMFSLSYRITPIQCWPKKLRY